MANGIKVIPVDRYKITLQRIGPAPDPCDNDSRCQVVCRKTGRVMGETKVRRHATRAHMEAVDIMRELA